MYFQTGLQVGFTKMYWKTTCLISCLKCHLSFINNYTMLMMMFPHLSASLSAGTWIKNFPVGGKIEVGQCLTSMITWFKSTRFLLVEIFKNVGVFISSRWCENSLKSNFVRSSENMQHVRNLGSSSCCNKTSSRSLHLSRRLTYGKLSVK
jgi:hypothetical protein